jgi:hypothetical protein
VPFNDVPQALIKFLGDLFLGETLRHKNPF